MIFNYMFFFFLCDDMFFFWNFVKKININILLIQNILLNNSLKKYISFSYYNVLYY